MNSIVQCLFMTHDFREKLIELYPIPKDKLDNITSLLINEEFEKSCVFNLCILFNQLKSGSQPEVKATHFRRTLKSPFSTSYDQQDASEFAKSLLQDIEDSLKNTNLRNLIEETFSGKVSTEVICKDCNHKSKVDEALDLMLSVSKKNYI